METTAPPWGDPELRADCASCSGLCCVALPFAASADFAVDKPAGQPCRNLDRDFRCGIHTRLRTGGFTGCAVYDCFGAGQKISRHTSGGDWRHDRAGAAATFAALPVVRLLQELRWYLRETLAHAAARPVHDRARELLARTEELTGLDPDRLAALDTAAHRQRVGAVLQRASELVRAPAGRRAKDRKGADLLGARLRGADLRGASLRGALLIAADLTGADLRGADLLGADLRDTELSGADLTGSLFLTRPQLNAARGDRATRLSPGVERPAHWS
ncbi:pentapeptide repeat-containing protein [Streptomyces sp. NPDC000594]|uniref:pentapeptide repeat-containing protein n=1 Tax=Streptomyces sp. NPDC000594 TaxID=3154261 RepID=UPI00332D99F6